MLSDREGSAFLTIKTLKTCSKISRDGVIKALKELNEIKLIWDFRNGKELAINSGAIFFVI